MSSLLRTVGICAVATSLWACGGAPPPQTPGQGEGVMVDDGSGTGTRMAAGGSESGPGPQLAPVPKPGELVLHFRWKNPGATLATAASFANLPPGFVNSNLREVVREGLREAIGDTVNVGKMAEVVSLDAPIDAVGVADTSRSGQVPDPMFAWSIGLSSLPRALKASNGKPEKIGDGIWRVGSKADWGSPCVVAASSGKTPARLVCAERSRDLALAAYLARNVAAMPEPAADFHAEVRMRGLFDKYGRLWASQARGLPVLAEELKLDIPAFDEAVKDAAEALAEEAGALLHDADAIIVDASLDRQSGVKMSLKMTFAGKRSWLVQTMIDGNQLAGPPPDMLWQLPKTSEGFAWGRSGDPARFTPILATGKALLLGALEHEKFATAGDRRALGKLLRMPTGKHVASVTASGHFAAAPSKGSKNMFGDLIDGVVGWHLVGVDEGPTKLKGYLNDLVKAYNRPTLQRLMKKEMGSEAKNLPKVRVTGAPRGLGAGSMALEIAIPEIEDPSEGLGLVGPPVAGPPPKAKKIVVKIHLLLMVDGNRTWIGMAADRDALAKLMKGLKGTTPGSNSLARRSELASLKRGRHSAGSVTSLDGALGVLKPMVMAFMANAPAGVAGPGQQVLTMLQKLPNKGATPITMFVDVKAGAKPGTSITMQIRRESLDDIGFLVNGIMQLANQP